MTEKEFKTFLEKHCFATLWIESILLRASATQIQSRRRKEGIFLTLEQAEVVATGARKKLATSISLIESLGATYEDLID